MPPKVPATPVSRPDRPRIAELTGGTTCKPRYRAPENACMRRYERDPADMGGRKPLSKTDRDATFMRIERERAEVSELGYESIVMIYGCPGCSGCAFLRLIRKTA